MSLREVIRSPSSARFHKYRYKKGFPSCKDNDKWGTFNYLFIFAHHFNEINIMKKVVGFSVALAAVLFAACDNKENSYNFAQIIYPSGYGSVLYADQTVVL